MAIQGNESSTMAVRLKLLREEKGLSHVRLSAALYEKYGVKISRDSLMSYEISDPYHSKAGKNQGMRVEYLRYLADFYGVSADYILGTSSTRSAIPDMQQAVQYSLLSEKAISTIRGLGNSLLPPSQLDKLNWLLSNNHFVYGVTSRLDNLERDAADFHRCGSQFNSMNMEYVKNHLSDAISTDFLEAEKNLVRAQDMVNLSLYKTNRELTGVLDEFVKEYCSPMPDDIKKQEEAFFHGND